MSEVYAKVTERMKEQDFTEEEIKTVIRAKEQLSNYTTVGSLIGGSGGLILARSRNFKGIQLFMLAGGGFLIGSQLGMLMGAVSSVKTIQSIPNFQRVVTLVNEMQHEKLEQHTQQRTGGGGSDGVRHDRTASFPTATMGGQNRYPASNGTTVKRGSEMLSDDAVYASQGFTGFKGGDGYHGGNDPNSASQPQNGSENGTGKYSASWAKAEQRAREMNAIGTHWDDIREKNAPVSSWIQIRQGKKLKKKKDDDDDEEEEDDDKNRNLGKVPKPKGWDKVRHGDGFDPATGGAPDGPSEFPRTREDFQARTNVKKNVYGDSI